MTMYAKKYNRELRVAQANKVTGGIDVDAIISLVDKDTAILSCMTRYPTTNATNGDNTRDKTILPIPHTLSAAVPEK